MNDYKIFISYRHKDNFEDTKQIYERLSERLGKSNVFLDRHDIPVFVDFEEKLIEVISKCHVLLVLIGSEWVNIFNQKQQSGEKDYVRLEIETAIKQDKIIAPLRLRQANMLNEEDKLPSPEMKRFAKLQAPSLQNFSNFYVDFNQILDHIDNLVFQINEPNFPSSNIDQELLETYLNEAAEYCLENQFDLSFEFAQKAIRLDPQCATAYFYRGYARGEQKDHYGAISDLTEAIDIDPNSVEYYAVRADEYFQIGEYDNAISDFTTTIKLNPKNTDVPKYYIDRGNSYAKKKQYSKAIEDYSEAKRIDPKSIKAYKALAITYLEAHKYAIENMFLGATVTSIRDSEIFEETYIKPKYKQAVLNSIQAYQKYLDLGGGEVFGDKDDVESLISQLRTELH